MGRVRQFIQASLAAAVLLTAPGAFALDPRANIERAVELIDAGQHSLARSYLAPALIDWRIAPSERSRAYYLRGWSFYAQNLYVSARKDYVRALEFNPGNAVVQTALGELHAYGLGVRQNQALALGFYLEAAEAGYDDAQFRLGYAYLEGEGVRADLAEARNWLQQAADQGHVQAMTNLARSYRAPFADPAEPETARRWYQTAFEAGHADALVPLAYMYEDGELGEPDAPRAFELLQQAAAAGSAHAKVSLGQEYLDGEVVPGDPTTAFSLFVEAARAEQPNAYLQLGYLYEFGLGVAQSITSAEDWYTRAAEAGLLYAHHRLANLLLERDEHDARQAALDWLAKAAAADDVEAHNHYAWLLATTRDDALRDGERALRHARRAVILEPSANTLDTLAAAYAELGQWEAAVSTQREAMDFLAEDDREGRGDLSSRLEAYRNRKAWRE